jgi:hypothetical protein
MLFAIFDVSIRKWKAAVALALLMETATDMEDKNLRLKSTEALEAAAALSCNPVLYNPA